MTEPAQTTPPELATAGKPENVILQDQEALRYRSGNPGTHLNLGKTLAARGQTNEAIQQLKEALLEAAKPK